MDNYVRIKILGKGSFGSAWLVERKKDRKQLVAKEVRLIGMKQADRESAKNEINMLRQLNHPNITRYVDHFEHNGSLYIVMEFANGGDLQGKISSRRGIRFSEKEVMQYFCQICLALMYLHEKRILHRDLKSQNVFLTRDGVVKLGDFGISTVLRNTFELKKTVCGTPYYFSPELCLSKPYNNKSDVWALGCILYELTTLTHAFEGNNMKALVQKILKGVYPPIHSSYSKDLSGLIQSMLRLDPTKRPNAHDIIQMPYVREHLANLQAQAANANRDHRSLVDPVERQRQQQEALKRVEEEKLAKAKREAEQKAKQELKEKEHQQRIEQIRAQMANEVKMHEEKVRQAKEKAQQAREDHQKADERRRLDMLEKLKRQEEDLRKQEAERKARELERQRKQAEERKRIDEDRKRWEEEKKKQDADRKARLARDLEIQRRREEEWEKNMKDLQEQRKREQQGANNVVPLGGAGGGAPPVSSNQQQQQQRDDKRSIDDQMRAQAYRDIRAAAEANKRKVAEFQKPTLGVDNNNNANANAGVRPSSKTNDQQQPPRKTTPQDENKSLDPEARRQAFIQMRKEAEENRKRAADVGNRGGGGAGKVQRSPPTEPLTGGNAPPKLQQPQQAQQQSQQQQQQPRNPTPQSTPVNSIDDQARREVFMQMRREAEANRRKLLGDQQQQQQPASSSSNNKNSTPVTPPSDDLYNKIDVVSKSPSQQNQQNQQQGPPKIEPEEVTLSDNTDSDDDDGDNGLHRFLNGEAVAKGVNNKNDNKDAEGAKGSESRDNSDVDEVETDKNDNNDKNENNNDQDQKDQKLKRSKREEDYKGVEDAISKALLATGGVNNNGNNGNNNNNNAADDFEDAAGVLADPFKLELDGKTFEIPNVQESDPLGHRIESLRFFLEKRFENPEAKKANGLLKIYRNIVKIDDCEDAEESEKMLEDLKKSLPEAQRKWLPLVTQLIVCEEAFNMQQNHG